MRRFTRRFWARYAYASVSTGPRHCSVRTSLRVRLRIYWSAPLLRAAAGGLTTRTPPYPLVGATAPLVPRYAYASGDGQEQTRFLSPYAPSIRPTGGKYLCAGE